jgi:N-acetylglucosaminyldiphosphoundecaprenol N-acetyl-beta-D-mannosaminyltransferase
VPSVTTIQLHGLRLHAATESQCIAHILDARAAERGGVVVTPNLDHLRRLAREPGLKSIYERADLVVADGMPLIWASRLQGTPLPQRVAGSSLIGTLSAAAAERGQSIYLLGGAPGAAERAAKVLQERHPRLVIAGIHCPPVGFEQDADAMATIQARLLAARPDIVYVGLGSPKQEKLIHQLRALLPAAWWLGVGVSFSFLSGEVQRAPRWMQRSGLEWLHRLVQEPRRLARRYLIEDLPFAFGLFAHALAKRFRQPTDADHHLKHTPDLPVSQRLK